MTTDVVSRGFRWVASTDGIAHARRANGRAVWTLCRIAAIPEQFARPGVVRCSRCQEVVDGPTR